MNIKQNQTGELLWRHTGGIHWRMLARRSGLILAGYSAGSTGKGHSAGYSAGFYWWAALVGYSTGSTGELLWDTQQLWRDTRRDPLASYSAGSTGELLWNTQRDTRRDPLASCSGGILGGIHWRAALAGYWVGAWCRSIANADSNIKSNNPFLSGGENQVGPIGPNFLSTFLVALSEATSTSRPETPPASSRVRSGLVCLPPRCRKIASACFARSTVLQTSLSSDPPLKVTTFEWAKYGKPTTKH